MKIPQKRNPGPRATTLSPEVGGPGLFQAVGGDWGTAIRAPRREACGVRARGPAVWGAGGLTSLNPGLTPSGGYGTWQGAWGQDPPTEAPQVYNSI